MPSKEQKMFIDTFKLPRLVSLIVSLALIFLPNVSGAKSSDLSSSQCIIGCQYCAKYCSEKNSSSTSHCEVNMQQCPSIANSAYCQCISTNNTNKKNFSKPNNLPAAKQQSKRTLNRSF